MDRTDLYQRGPQLQTTFQPEDHLHKVSIKPSNTYQYRGYHPSTTIHNPPPRPITYRSRDHYLDITKSYVPRTTFTMCVTNVYVDRYPDGKELEFRHTEICQYGAPGRPCAKLSTLENPVRNIQFGEPTTEYMIVAQYKRSLPQTPPRSAGNSHHRRQSSSVSSEDKNANEGIRRRSSKREVPALRPTRTHRKERIVIVDSPPTPRTPPQVYNQTSLPNSPATPPFIIDGLPRERGRPIIVDERPLQRDREILREGDSRRNSNSHTQQRNPSIGAVVGNRRNRRSTSRERFGWDSPSSSHTSFDSRAQREAEEIERRKRELEELEREREKAALDRELKEIERAEKEREERIKALEVERRREERIRAQDEEIRRRPAVPVPPSPPRKGILKPTVVSKPVDIPERRMSVGERALIEEKEIRRRLEEMDREMRERMVENEEEALRMRLKERQMPRRRFSVGPGNRRHRVLYDDGVYRWE